MRVPVHMVASVVILLTLALIYGYLNGLHGSASIAATMISSRAVPPRAALLLATAGICVGPLLLGTAVANTISAQFIRQSAGTVQVAVSALAGAICWSALTFWLRIPSSISQALIGGLFGAVWAGFGANAVLAPGLLKVVLGLLLSPLLGLLIGYAVVRLCYTLGSYATPHVNVWFNRGQVLISFLLAAAFGANDGQKITGVLMLGLISTGLLDTFTAPLWVVMFGAAAIGCGTFMGGWRVMNTLGSRVYNVRPVHGFGAQAASAAVLLSAGLLGGPVSGSQVVTSAIVGAGSADRLKKVRWGLVQDILISWLLTLPSSALIGAAVYFLLARAL